MGFTNWCKNGAQIILNQVVAKLPIEEKHPVVFSWAIRPCKWCCVLIPRDNTFQRLQEKQDFLFLSHLFSTWRKSKKKLSAGFGT